MIDSSSIRVHQHMAATPKKDGRSDCMVRSRGGLTTRIHALVDSNGLPVTLKLSAGQAYDDHSAAGMLDSLDAGDVLLADRHMMQIICAMPSLRRGLGQHPGHAATKAKVRLQRLPLPLPRRTLFQ